MRALRPVRPTVPVRLLFVRYTGGPLIPNPHTGADRAASRLAVGASLFSERERNIDQDCRLAKPAIVATIEQVRIWLYLAVEP
jgi:hypothetical protein